MMRFKKEYSVLEMVCFFGALVLAGVLLVAGAGVSAIVTDKASSQLHEFVDQELVGPSADRLAPMPQEKDYWRPYLGTFSTMSAQQFEQSIDSHEINLDVLLKVMLPMQDDRPMPTARSPLGCSGCWVFHNGKLFYLTADHCMTGVQQVYPIEVHFDTEKIAQVFGSIWRTNGSVDISMLSVDESQFDKLPRAFEVSDTAPQEGEYVIVCGANAYAPHRIHDFPGSRNNAVRILKVGRQVGADRWLLNDAAWSGHSGGCVISAKTGQVIGVVSSTDTNGRATFASVQALGLKPKSSPKIEKPNMPNQSSVSTESELILVTQQGCPPCETQRAQLNRLGVEYRSMDYREAKRLGWRIQQTPTLVAFNGSHPTAYSVGAFNDQTLTQWLEEHVSTNAKNSPLCENGVCPVPEKSERERECRWLIWLLVIAAAIYIARRRN